MIRGTHMFKPTLLGALLGALALAQATTAMAFPTAFRCNLFGPSAPVAQNAPFGFSLQMIRNYVYNPSTEENQYLPARAPYTAVFYGYKNGVMDIPYPGPGYTHPYTFNSSYNGLTGYQNVPGAAGVYDRFVVVYDSTGTLMCNTMIATVVLQ
jgi:hypothetical protein